MPKTLGSDGTDIGAVERAAPPDTVITSGPAAGATITTDSASFGFAGDPAAETAKLQCKLDSEPFTDCTSPKTFTGLSNGSHTVAFRAVNAAGEADPSPATRSFNVDATTPVPPDPPVPPVAPDTVITAGPIEGKTISRNRARFRFAGDPAATTAKLQCSLDREAFADCASPQTFDALGEGSHTVAFRAVDADGNADPTPATRRFIVDTAVADPFLRMKNPQLQGNKKVKLRVKAGAGEDVTAIASGRIRLGHGNAVKLRSEAVVAGGRVQLVLKPRPGFGGNRRIKKALREGRKAKAEIDARIKDVAGNKYYKLLEAKLKLRNRG